jgi:oligogalacturonide lyase
MKTLLSIQCAALLCGFALQASDAGKDWGIEKRSWTDPLTGVRVWEMTGSKDVANSLYFHFPNFTRDNRYLLFMSNRSGSNQIYGIAMPEGRIVQLTDAPGVVDLVPDYSNPRRIYYRRGADLMALDVETRAERLVGPLPGTGDLTMSRDGKWVAQKKHIDANTSEIWVLSTETGQSRRVARTGFHIGHVQHSPTQPLIFFAWETNDYAPQRSWLVNSDGESPVRPFYYRLERRDWFSPLKEVATHEAWIMDTGDMTMVNHNVGIMIVRPDGTSRLVTPGKFWHVHARPDGKFIVADDFEGRLWLVETATGSTRLLATGLRNPKDVHLHPSFDWKGRYIVFNVTCNHRAIGVVDLSDLPAQPWR